MRIKVGAYEAQLIHRVVKLFQLLHASRGRRRPAQRIDQDRRLAVGNLLVESKLRATRARRRERLSSQATLNPAHPFFAGNPLLLRRLASLLACALVP